jgi:hypothetical protein
VEVLVGVLELLAGVEVTVLGEVAVEEAADLTVEGVEAVDLIFLPHR